MFYSILSRVFYKFFGFSQSFCYGHVCIIYKGRNFCGRINPSTTCGGPPPFRQGRLAVPYDASFIRYVGDDAYIVPHITTSRYLYYTPQLFCRKRNIVPLKYSQVFYVPIRFCFRSRQTLCLLFLHNLQNPEAP